ncbi:CRISPR-associated endonuclease Cas2 [Kiritimatiellaeota bacterium B1221]|nr:CRISPR-associated endonuclease Cas2 [Kiritimatiellaeota bacterium B1221]
MSSHQLAAESYRIMWLFVFFDLPVISDRQRKRATRFRKDLLDDGFSMMQFSVYIRHCASKENATVHVNRIRKRIPPEGHVSIVAITDKQFGNILNVRGAAKEESPSAPAQLEMF